MTTWLILYRFGDGTLRDEFSSEDGWESLAR